MAPPAAQQIISALQVIRGDDGTDRGARKIAALHENSNYFRQRLQEMGCNVLGDWDSPVMVSGFGQSLCLMTAPRISSCPRSIQVQPLRISCIVHKFLEKI